MVTAFKWAAAWKQSCARLFPLFGRLSGSVILTYKSTSLYLNGTLGVLITFLLPLIHNKLALSWSLTMLTIIIHYEVHNEVRNTQ